MKNLVRLNDIDLKENEIPFKAGTLRWWRAKGKYPSIFKKIGHSVFLDLEKFKETFLGNQEA